MINRRALSVIIGLLLAGIVLIWLTFKGCGRAPIVAPVAPAVPAVAVSTAPATVPAPPAVPVVPLVAPKPVTVAKPVTPPVSPKPKPVAKPPVEKPLSMQPPPVPIFKELIPKNIDIVRVYYAGMLNGPDSTIEFDINGSGFTQEFQKMITVESGVAEVSVRNLSLVTPNQIHGTLVIGPKAKTGVAFPKVLIQGKVVFQAPDPFGVVRPGEVLNLIFTDMGESGRTGRFRVFTNLDETMFRNFHVEASTPAITIINLTPSLPFIVEGTIAIGPAVGGDYGIAIKLNDKVIWNKDSIIRVVRPNVGQSGLLQRVLTNDGFHRPGDRATFTIQGSGFQRQDPALLQASVKGLNLTMSTFTYVAPGRLELVIGLPYDAPVKKYGLTVSHAAEVLLDVPEAFEIVEKNWTRGLQVEPDLTPGGKATLKLMGRDLDPVFVSKIKVEVDDPALEVGTFVWKDAQEADAALSAGAGMKPGDYWLHLTSGGSAVAPQFGSIIRVIEKK